MKNLHGKFVAKSKIKSVILVICSIVFGFFLNSCEKKKKPFLTGDGYFDSKIIGCIIDPEPKLCTDNFWTAQGNNVHSGYIELNDLDVKVCGGLTKINGRQIYNDKGILIKDSYIQNSLFLKCKRINDSGFTSFFENAKYSWYIMNPLNSKSANLLFVHTNIQDNTGSPSDVDNFSSYKIGDSLLCCHESIVGNECNTKYKRISCEKITIQ